MVRKIVAGAALAATALTLAGCDLFKSKEEAVCLDILKTLVADPKSVQVNESRSLQADSSVGELRKIRAAASVGKIGEAAAARLDMMEREGDKITKTYVSLDTTYEGRLGKVRDDVLCVYINYQGERELVSFTSGRRDYNQKQLRDYFLLPSKRPDKLDYAMRIK